MKTAALSIVVALGLAISSGAARADPKPDAIGFWLNQEQGWVVETVACDSGICGYLVGFRKTNGPGYVAKDTNNPDASRRAVPLCGLQLLGGFTPTENAAGNWEHGWVYDPDTGSTYRGVAEITGPDTIEVRGFVLIPLFGRTLTLVRETGPATRCVVPRAGAQLEAAASPPLAPMVVSIDLTEARRR
jgi:uncharacterized protein (DUF2147 family)